jgi:hypothetical protein
VLVLDKPCYPDTPVDDRPPTGSIFVEPRRGGGYSIRLKEVGIYSIEVHHTEDLKTATDYAERLEQQNEN